MSRTTSDLIIQAVMPDSDEYTSSFVLICHLSNIHDVNPSQDVFDCIVALCNELRILRHPYWNYLPQALVPDDFRAIPTKAGIKTDLTILLNAALLYKLQK